MGSRDDDRWEIVTDFIQENRSRLDELEPQLQEWEESMVLPADNPNQVMQAMEELLRSMHSLAAKLELPAVTEVIERAEGMLLLLRQQCDPLTAEQRQLLLHSRDFIRSMLFGMECQWDEQAYAAAAHTFAGEIGGMAAIDQNEAATVREPAFSITPVMVQRFADEALQNFDEAESALLALEENSENTEAVEEAFRCFHSFKGNAGFFGYAELEEISHQAENVLDCLREKRQVISPQLITTLLTVLDGLRGGISRLAAGEKEYLPQKTALLQLLAVWNEAAVDSAACAAPVTAAAAVTGAEITAHRQMMVRVDVDKLDLLLDLVGELVLAQDGVVHNPDLQGLALEHFDKAVMHLAKITRDVQDVAMALRMVPLRDLFRKMVRVVRDVALKDGKQVELQLAGETTEVDKNIVECLADPLIHMMRNAVSHGIELPAERLATGKAETGQLRLEAKQVGGEVWIMLTDDGRGLCREAIIDKAVAQGRLTQSAAAALRDEDVWKLIFAAGLSTATTVSAISGRGVGMDVVQRNLAAVRGRTDIRSARGQGTQFILKIPLTLAMIDGMIVRAGTRCYAIPVAAIHESFRPRPEQLTCLPNGAEVVDVRGQLLPVVRLHEFYRHEARAATPTEGILLLVEGEERRCCLLVDELQGQQQVVVKAVSPLLGTIRGITGFAILGSGEVSMVLDMARIIANVQE